MDLIQQEINLSDFVIDDSESCLKGKVAIPKFNLAGAKLIIPNHPEIEGFVVELFSIVDIRHALLRAPGIDFNVGDWYINIKIFSDWSSFKEMKIKSFYLTERDINEVNLKKIKRSKNSMLFKFKNMSLKYFDNYYIDLRGGETGGAGRNEHGDPHFHIIRKKDNKDLGKVFFPTIEDFKANEKQLVFSEEIRAKRKKEITEWVFNKNQENLIKLNCMWTLQNNCNNRVHK